MGPKGRQDWAPYKPKMRRSRKDRGPKIEQREYEINFQKTIVPMNNLIQFLYNIENGSQGIKVIGVKAKGVDPTTFEWDSPIVDIAFYRKEIKKSKR